MTLEFTAYVLQILSMIGLIYGIGCNCFFIYVGTALHVISNILIATSIVRICNQKNKERQATSKWDF